MADLLNIILHFNQYLPQFFADYGLWVYALVFLIVFCETGLVVTPFLPGDSMLFALGAFAAQQEALDIRILAIGLFLAAVGGDNLNYAVGRFLGKKLLDKPRRFFKPAYYEKAHAFYEKWGGKAVVLARFVPIVRTFSPFTAGVARMSYRKFLAYDVGGGALWIGLFLGAGYALGNVAWVQHNFEIIVPVIIVVSVLPIVVELARAKLAARRARAAGRA